MSHTRMCWPVNRDDMVPTWRSASNPVHCGVLGLGQTTRPPPTSKLRGRVGTKAINAAEAIFYFETLQDVQVSEAANQGRPTLPNSFPPTSRYLVFNLICMLHNTTMKVTWERLIRFVATDGRILHGEPILPSAQFDLGDTTEAAQLRARVIKGHDIYDTTGLTKVTDEIVTVKTLLGPLTPSNVPILRCIGLNYATHGTPCS